VELVNVQHNRGKSEKYAIRSIPTFVYVQDGREISRRRGKQSAESLRRMCHGYWF
jgi:thioredoxin-like negative regulator of GroEL